MGEAKVWKRQRRKTGWYEEKIKKIAWTKKEICFTIGIRHKIPKKSQEKNLKSSNGSSSKIPIEFLLDWSQFD